MINKNSKIFLAGHSGMIGSALLRKLEEKKFKKVHTITKAKLDLRNQEKVFKYLNKLNQSSNCCSCKGWRNII